MGGPGGRGAPATTTSCKSSHGPAHDKAYASGLLYWPHGAVERLQFGNGLWEQTGYSDDRLQPKDLRLGLTAGSVEKWQLENDYDPSSCPVGRTACNNGNVVGQTMTLPGQSAWDLTYGYDAVNRLLSATEKRNSVQTWNQGYGYDTFGNRTASDDLPSPSVTPGSFSDSTNRIADAGYGYDLAGNLDETPGGRTMKYGAENRQVELNDNGSVYTYAYDGDGRRVKKTAGTKTTLYVYDASGALAAEYEHDTDPPDPPPTPPCQTCYLTTDHLGSTRVMSDAGGEVVRRYDYLPFGEEIPGWGGRSGVAGYVTDEENPKFTGQVRDYESGLKLDYFGARYLSASMGRFTTPDAPFADQQAGDPQSWNLYGYVRGNPLKYVDIDGLKKLLSIYVDQPGDGGSRQAARAQANPLSPDVGHTYVGLRDTDLGQDVRVGFYPKSGGLDVRRGDMIAGGEVKNDANHEWDVGREFEVSDEQFSAALNQILADKEDAPGYDLNENNCTDWAIGVAASAGVDLPQTEGEFKYLGKSAGSGTNPADLGEDIRAMKEGTLILPEDFKPESEEQKKVK